MPDLPHPNPGETQTGRIVCLSTTPTMQRTLVFDSITAGDENRAREVLEFASGKAVNVARVLHTLGHDCLFVGPAGGERGQRLRRDLQEAGVAFDIVDAVVDTRLCVTVVDRARRQATELVEESPPLSPEVASEVLERLAGHLPSASVLVMSGSLAPQIPVDFYARAVRMAREAGVHTLLDARGEPLRQALRERPDVVKPNRPELAATVGKPVESRNAMREAMVAMVAQGAGHVVVTRGRDGSSVSDGSRVWEVSTPRIEMTSPIGSGDAYAAGLALGLREHVPLPEACRYAAACGAANAETLRAGFLDPDRVAELVGEVTIREIS